MKRCGPFVLLLAVALLGGEGLFAEDRIEEVIDPGARFADAVLEELNALRVPCPLDLTDGLPADRVAYCAKLRHDEASFRKDWKKAVRRGGSGRWRPVAVSRWMEDPGLITRYYDLDYVQVVAIFDTETRALMIVQERVLSCPGLRSGADEVAHEACVFDAGTDPESVLECPEPLEKAQPVLPDSLRIDPDRRQGELVATLSIDARGAMEAICVVSAEPPRKEWIRNAIHAFREWRFAPATRDGEPVPVRRTLIMSYSFN